MTVGNAMLHYVIIGLVGRYTIQFDKFEPFAGGMKQFYWSECSRLRYARASAGAGHFE